MFKCIRHFLLLIGLVGWGTLLLGQSGLLNVDVDQIAPSSCSINDGSISIQPLNGTAPYQYSIDGGATFSSSNTFFGLGSGSYIIMVRDANAQLSMFLYIQLAAPGAPLIDGISFQNPTTCDGTGQLSIDASGGSGALEYSLNNGNSFKSISTFTNIVGGTYRIVVRNQDGTCAVTHPPITYTPIYPSDFINASFITQEPDCNTDNGTIEIRSNRDISNYSFSIDGGATFQNSPVFSNLVHGNYEVILSDPSTNCEKNLGRVTFSSEGCPPPVPCDAIIEDDIITLTNCEDRVPYCLNIPLNQLDQYAIYVDGALNTASFSVCQENNNSVALSFPKGRHLIQVIRTATRCQSTAYFTVKCSTSNENHCGRIESQTRELSGQAIRDTFCLNLPLNQLHKFEVYQNGAFVNDRLISCPTAPSQAALVLELGTTSVIINEIGVCRDVANITVTNDSNPEPCSDFIQNTSITLTNGNTQTLFCLNIPLTELNNYEVRVNGMIAASLLSCSQNQDVAALTLLRGDYTIEIINRTNRCSDTATVTVSGEGVPVNCEDLVIPQTTILDRVGGAIVICLGIPLDDVSNYRILVNGTPPPSITFCGTTGFAALILREGTFLVEVSNLAGDCTDQGTIIVQRPIDPTNPQECLRLLDNATFTLASGQQTIRYCINISDTNVPDFRITVNGQEVSTTLCESIGSEAAILLPIGTHLVRMEHSNRICIDEATVIVRGDSPENCDSLIGNSVFNLPNNASTITYCLNIPLAEVTNYTISNNGIVVNLTGTSCPSNASFAAIQLPQGTHNIVLNNSVTNCIDEATITVNPPSSPPCVNFIQDGNFQLIENTESVRFCLNIPQVEISNYTIEVARNGQDFIPTLSSCTQDATLTAIDLLEGTNVVKINRVDGTCSDNATIAITSSNPPPPTCEDFIQDGSFQLTSVGGSLRYCLNVPRTELSTYSLEVTRDGEVFSAALNRCSQDTSLTAIELLEGVNVVRLTKNDGTCSDTATVRVLNPTNCEDVLTDGDILDVTECDRSHIYCFGLPNDQEGNYTLSVDGNANVDFASCPDSDELGVSLDVGSHQIILSNSQTGCIDSATITIRCLPPTLATLTDTIIVGGTGTICIDTSLLDGPIVRIENGCPEKSNDLVNFTIDTATLCVTYTSTNGPGLGEACIIICDEADNCGTINIAITVLPKDNEPFVDEIKLNDRDSFCIDTSPLSGNIISMTNTCPEEAGTAITFTLDTISRCVFYTASEEGSGKVCIEIRDDRNNCIRQEITVSAAEPRDAFRDTVSINQTDTFCLDTTQFAGTISSIMNTCPEQSGTAVTFTIDSSNYCVYYMGNQEGNETACIRICDDQNNCATTEISIVVTENRIFFSDNIPLNTSDTFCLDTTQLAGNITSIRNTCPDSSGEAIIFNIDTATYCIRYTAMEVGTEIACMELCDDLGNCFTTELSITAFDQRQVFDTTILVGAIDTFCIDTSLIIGPITSIRNTCPELADSAVTFTIDTLSRCIIYEGDEVGVGEACIEICNATNQCDTINITIRVEEDTVIAPIAVADIDTTNAGVEITLNILDNDTLTRDDVEITIVAMPPNGTVMVNLDGTISYTPNDDFCDTTDLFMYRVCNSAGCDTARVTIYIRCTNLEIMDGFSPNGDGMNDFFTINGIEGFPLNRLQIFDRRGTRVFQASPYNNDWDGTWEGEDLPSGIYFYLFEDGKNNDFSGYLVLRR